eukprot:Ihof_evm3s381 gene=Ihof_evmTU3s381
MTSPTPPNSCPNDPLFFGAYVCKRVQNSGDRISKWLEDSDQIQNALKLLENAADFFFFRERLRFMLCAEELFRHTHAYNLYRSQDPIPPTIIESANGASSCSWTETAGFFSSEAYLEKLTDLLQALWVEYLDSHWGKIDVLQTVSVARRSLLMPHAYREEEHSVQTVEQEFLQELESSVIEVNDGKAYRVGRGRRSMVLFHVHHCPGCRSMKPVYFASARVGDSVDVGKLTIQGYQSQCISMSGVYVWCIDSWGQAMKGKMPFLMVDGQLNPGLQVSYGVTRYPTVFLLRQGEKPITYPGWAPYTMDSLLAFARTGQIGIPKGDARQWQIKHKTQLRNNLANKLQAKRAFVSLAERFRLLGCTDENACRAMTRSHNPGDIPPTIIFMGGGMGSGKSTVVAKLTTMDFWQKYGSQVVVVEADALKLKDPVYQMLSLVGQGADHEVHTYSVQKAEELFLSAIQYRRDVVFDGTMSWLPFVQQTVAMVRDNTHTYTRGPGCVTLEDGQVVEKYWEISGTCEPGPAYRVEMVGVTVDPEVAVQRAMVRELATGRGVPVEAQLKSHQMFSKEFENYVGLFDKVSLYDNNSIDTLLKESPAAPRLIASKELDGLLLVHPPLYEKFLAK